MEVRTSGPGQGRILAVLGPTNTGKTHLAIERMLGHRTGMIGFPLRLLARENYDRIVRERGAAAVALITGEERIMPPHPAYLVCTVEAMPVERPVDFLAVDEIQLCADPERGHVFTDRLLHARGGEETLFLGAETIRPLIRRLVPRAEFVNRPRLSQLSYSGHRKLTRLPPRSAVVAFSAPDVYAMAELIRRQRGGTAVVLGALSPRTRNAQVALYQAGEVDYLVATDAIGMGLNMDVSHVAFARLSKFDGRVPRRLTAPEIAQIAGRAGRHLADGTFGTTGEVDGIAPETVAAIEAHQFEPLKALMWRNDALDFTSPAALLASLDRAPARPELLRAREADDHAALAALAGDAEIVRLASGRAGTRLLWEACQIPDFRKVLSDSHVRLVGQVFRHLREAGRLPTDWVARQVARLDRSDGDIDALVARIAHVRTWTFVSHRADWLDDPGHWQERARALEDRLSDALHERLTQRFVDRRQARLARTLRDGGTLMAAVDGEGSVRVEGHEVGRLDGLRFTLDPLTAPEDRAALASAARRALGREISGRLAALEADGDDAFHLDGDGTLSWRGHSVGRLAAGPTPRTPGVQALHDALLDAAQTRRLVRRLERWVADRIARDLAPLDRLAEGGLEGAARGIAFQLVEGLGGLERAAAAPLLESLDREARRALARHGVRLAPRELYVAPVVKPAAVALRALLWAVHAGRGLPAPVPPPGRVSVIRAGGWPDAYWRAIGYPACGPRAIRADILERFERRLYETPAPPVARLAQEVGCTAAELPEVLAALGFRLGADAEGQTVLARPRQRRPARRGPSAPEPHRDSPFAGLKELARLRQLEGTS